MAMNDILRKLHVAGVRYLLIGGQAMRLTGMPRTTMDWDFFIPPRDEKNISLLNNILEDELDLQLVSLGAQGQNFVQTYQTLQGILQFHLVVPGISNFEDAEKSAIIRMLEGSIPVKCLSGTHLLAAKLAANRPQDQTDIQFLQELKRLGKL
jgi:hypothetical protein